MDVKRLLAVVEAAIQAEPPSERTVTWRRVGFVGFDIAEPSLLAIVRFIDLRLNANTEYFLSNGCQLLYDSSRHALSLVDAVCLSIDDRLAMRDASSYAYLGHSLCGWTVRVICSEVGAFVVMKVSASGNMSKSADQPLVEPQVTVKHAKSEHSMKYADAYEDNSKWNGFETLGTAVESEKNTDDMDEGTVSKICAQILHHLTIEDPTVSEDTPFGCILDSAGIFELQQTIFQYIRPGEILSVSDIYENNTARKLAEELAHFSDNSVIEVFDIGRSLSAGDIEQHQLSVSHAENRMFFMNALDAEASHWLVIQWGMKISGECNELLLSAMKFVTTNELTFRKRFSSPAVLLSSTESGYCMLPTLAPKQGAFAALDLSLYPGIEILNKYSQQSATLSFSMHHAHWDGASFSILRQRVENNISKQLAEPDFENFSSNIGSRIEPNQFYQVPKISPKDYSEIEFRSDKSSTGMESFLRQSIAISLSARNNVKLLKHLQTLAEDRSVHSATILVCASALHISQHTDQTAFALPFTMSLREKNTAEMGCFINTVLIAVDLQGETIKECLQAIENSMHVAYDCRAIPFERMVKEIKKDKHEKSFLPFKSFLLNFWNESSKSSETSPEDILSTGLAHIDLSLCIVSMLKGFLEYNPRLFYQSTARRHMQQFITTVHTLVQSIIVSKSQKLHLEWHKPLGDKQIENICVCVKDDNSGRLEYSNHFLNQITSGGGSVTYQGKRVSLFSSACIAQCLAISMHQMSGQRVGIGGSANTVHSIMICRSLEFLLSILAIYLQGQAYSPIDVKFPEERIQYLINTVQPKILITKEIYGSLRTNSRNIGSVRPNFSSVRHSRLPSDLGYVLFTSGTTGYPKGVCINVSSLIATVQDTTTLAKSLGAHTRFFQTANFIFDVSAGDIGMLLTHKCHFNISDSIVESATLAPKHRPDYIYLITALVNVCSKQHLKALALTEVLVTSGERLQQAHSAESGLRLLNLYGPTETTVYSTGCFVHAGASSSDLIGHIFRSETGHVLSKFNRDLPMGIEGQLCIGGTGVCRGYFKRPITSSSSVGVIGVGIGMKNLYSTGDRVKQLPDGQYLYYGRRDFQVKFRGYRIELQEIESACYEVTGVQHCIILLSSKFAHQLTCFYTKSEPTDSCLHALKEHLNTRLPAYMVPHSFYELDSFPLTPTLKVDRSALQGMEHSVNDSCTVDGQPSNQLSDLEQKVLSTWEKLVTINAPSADCDFFACGGNSILAMQLIDMYRITFPNVSFKMQSIFQFSTLGTISNYISMSTKSDCSKKVSILAPICKTPEHEALVLSPIQNQMWFMHFVDPAISEYINLSCVLHYCQVVNGNILKDCLNAVVTQNAIFRTIFSASEDCVTQFPISAVQSYHCCMWQKVKMDNLTLFCSPEFSLTDKTPFRFNNIEVDNKKHLLSMIMHHILGEGWTYKLLLDFISTRYQQALELSCQSNLSANTYNYYEYAQKMDSLAYSEENLQQRKYWQSYLANMSHQQLLTDKFRVANQSYNRSMLLFSFHNLGKCVVGLASEHRYSEFVLMLGAYSLVLFLHSELTDVLVGCPFTDRDFDQAKETCGLFMNLLPIRVKLDQTVFKRLLNRLRDEVINALGQQKIQYRTLLEYMGADSNPRYEIMLNFRPIPIQKFLEANITDETIISSGASFLDAGVNILNVSQDILGLTDYNCNLFYRSSMDRMMGMLQAAVAKLPYVISDNIPSSQLRVMSEYQVMHTSDRVQSSALGVPCDKQLSIQRQNTWLCTQHLLKTETVHMTNKLAHQTTQHVRQVLSHSKRASCQSADFFVTLKTGKHLSLLATTLGILNAGMIYVPIDPCYPQQRIHLVMTETGSEMLQITSHRSEWSHGNTNWKTSDHINLCYCIYTSGTTGIPKGVCIQHSHAFIATMSTAILIPSIREGSPIYQSTKFVFDISVFDIFLAVASTARLQIADDKLAALAEIGRVRAEFANMSTALVNAWDLLAIRKGDICCEHITVCGEVLQKDASHTLSLAGTFLTNLYGTTEATVFSHAKRQSLQCVAANIGTTLAGASDRVLDSLQLPVSMRAVGQLYVGGYTVSRGYFRRPEITSRRFITQTNSIETFHKQLDNRVYNSGDTVEQLSQGELFFIGRSDFQIKLFGHRIELGELESQAVLSGHVKQAVATAIRNRVDNSVEQIALFFSSTDLSAQGKLQEYFTRNFPPHMIPGVLIRVEQFSLNNSGKVDRAALSQLYSAWQQSQNLDGQANDSGTEGEIEIAVRKIWQNLLPQLPTGPQSNFFHLGGNSLHLIKLRNLYQSAFGVELALAELFKYCTLESVSFQIGKAQTRQKFTNRHLVNSNSERTTDQAYETSSKSIARTIPSTLQSQPGAFPLSTSQTRFVFLSEFAQTGQTFWIHCQQNLSLINPGILKNAIGQLIGQQHSLRTVFNADTPVKQETTSHTTAYFLTTVMDKEDQKIISENNQIYSKLLLNIALSQQQTDNKLFIEVLIHHAITDGLSIRQMFRQLATNYTELLAGKQNIHLNNEKCLRYFDFVEWERLQLESFQDELKAYWKSKLYNYAFSDSIPRDILITQGKTDKSGLMFKYNTKPSGSNEWNMNYFGQVLMSVFLAMHYNSGEEDLIICYAASLKEQFSSDAECGCYVNTLPTRCCLNSTLSFREMFESVVKSLRLDLEHQLLPYSDINLQVGRPDGSSLQLLSQIIVTYISDADSETGFADILSLSPSKESNDQEFSIELGITDVTSRVNCICYFDAGQFFSKTILKLLAKTVSLFDGISMDMHSQARMIKSSETSAFTNSTVSSVTSEVSSRSERPIDRVWASHHSYPGLFQLRKQLSFYTAALTHFNILQLAKSIHSCVLQTTSAAAPDQAVATMQCKSIKAIVSIFSILNSGHCYVPLDPSYPQMRKAFIFSNTSSAVCLGSSGPSIDHQKSPAFVPSAGTAGPNILRTKSASMGRKNKAIDLAYILFTSGTTGTPKGISIPHSNVVAMAHAHTLFYSMHRPGAVFAQVASLQFDVSVHDLALALFNSSTLYVFPSANVLSDSLRRHPTDFLVTVPAVISQLLPAELKSLQRLEKLVLGGESFHDNLMNSLLDSGIDLSAAYGPTEICVSSTAHRFSKLDSSSMLGNEMQSEFSFLDAPQSYSCAAELCIWGAGIARGYHNRTELSLDRFLSNPKLNRENLSKGFGLVAYRTGDVCSTERYGTLQYMSRVDDQVKIYGQRIELAEIEHVLQNESAVKQATVLVTSLHASEGISAKDLVAFIVPANGIRSSEIENLLRQTADEGLPGYMNPNQYIFLDVIPKTDNGKIDRRKLEGYIGEARKVQVQQEPIIAEVKKDWTLFELQIAEICSELLHTWPTNVEDSLFKLGANSMTMFGIRDKVKSRFNVYCELPLLFKNNTIKTLAKCVESRMKSSPVASTVVEQALIKTEPQTKISEELSSVQKQFWFQHNLHPSKSHYLQGIASIEYRGMVNNKHLMMAYTEAMCWTTSFRTIFLNETAHIKATRLSCTEFSPGLLVTELTFSLFSEIALEMQYKAVLSEPKMLRVRFLLESVRPSSLYSTINGHHILSDAYSSGLFQEHISETYNKLQSAGNLTLTSKMIANCLRDATQPTKNDSDYWRNQLDGYKDLDLPLDKPRGALLYDRQTLHIDLAATELDSFVRNLQVTKPAALFGCLHILLQWYTDSCDFLIAYPINMRQNESQNQDMRCLINTLPVKLASMHSQLGSWFRSVSHIITEAFEHSTMEFERLVAMMECERNLHAAPLCQVRLSVPEKAASGQQFPALKTAFHQWSTGAVEVDWAFGLQTSRDQVTGYIDYNCNLFTCSTMVKTIYYYSVLVQNICKLRLDAHLMKVVVLEHTKAIHDLRQRETYNEVMQHCITFNSNSDTRPWICLQDDCMLVSKLHCLATISAKVAALRLMHGRSDGSTAHPDQAHCIEVSKTFHYLTTAQAVVTAGFILVPLDAEHPAERKRYIQHTTGSHAIQTAKEQQSDFHLNLRTSTRQSTFMGDLSFIVFTSGTTGKPKGVTVSHRSHLACVHSTSLRIRNRLAESKQLQATSLIFDLSMYDLGLMAVSSLSFEVTSSHKQLDAMLLKLNESRVASLMCVTTLINNIAVSKSLLTTLASLETTICAGDGLSQLASEALIDVGARLNVGYGPSETTIISSSVMLKVGQPHTLLGHPLAGEFFVNLGKDLCTMSTGTVGQLHIAGIGLTRGYIGTNVVNTKCLFSQALASPWSNQQSTVYSSGDLVKQRIDGGFDFVGRADFQIKRFGFRIELAEIETAITQTALVKRCIVLSLDTNLVAFCITPKTITHNDVKLGQAIRQELAQSLPGYMIPSHVMSLKLLPTTSNTGKTDRAKLKSMFEGRKTAQTNVTTKAEPCLEAVRRLWQDLLGESVVDVEKNIFDLGGTSIHLMQLRNMYSKVFKVEVDIKQLLRHTTVRSISTYLNRLLTNLQPIKIKTKPIKRVLPAITTQLTDQRAEDSCVILAFDCHFSNCETYDIFWSKLLKGSVCTERESGKDIQHENFIPISGRLSDTNKFDYYFWGMSKSDANKLSPKTRKFMESCWNSLERNNTSERSIGTFAGCGYHKYNHISSDDADSQRRAWEMMIMNEPHSMASRVNYHLNLTGPAISVSTACSTGLTAISVACQSLRAGHCQMALAGAAAFAPEDHPGYFYGEGMILSRDGYCRVFDEDATGTVPGGGIGSILIGTQSGIKSRGFQHTLAEIKAIGINNDGSQKVGFTAPGIDGQVACIKAAHTAARVLQGENEISYLECHGTGTILGDPLEVAAIHSAFVDAEFNEPCILGAVKANIGHTDAAAGIAGVTKVCLMFDSGCIPPQVNYKKLNPTIQLDDNKFRICLEKSVWMPKSNHVAGISSFGIGGTNVHVVIARYTQEHGPPNASAIQSTMRQHVPCLFVSAKTKTSCEKYILQLKNYLASNTGADIGTVSNALARKPRYKFRHAIPAMTSQDALERYNENDYRNEVRCADDAQINPIVMFPGQGILGLTELKSYLNTAEAKPAFIEMAMQELRALRTVSGVYIDRAAHAKCTTNNDVLYNELLHSTEWQQPLIWILSKCLHEKYRQHAEVSQYIGHSLGQYSAVMVSGLVDTADALPIIYHRSRLMQNTENGLAMIITHSAFDQEAMNQVSIAARLTPSTLVVSGATSEILALNGKAKNLGYRCKLLAVNRAFHSSLMLPMLSQFIDMLDLFSFRPIANVVQSNLSGRACTNSELANPMYWADHMAKAVQLSGCIMSATEEMEAPVFISLDQNQSLLSCVQQHGLANDRAKILRHKDFLWTVEETLCKLWMVGYDISLETVRTSPIGHTWLNQLPTYQFEAITCEQPKATETIGKSGNVRKDKYEFYATAWEECAVNVGILNQIDSKSAGKWLIFCQDKKHCANICHVFDTKTTPIFVKWCTTNAKPFSIRRDQTVIINPIDPNSYALLADYLEHQKYSVFHIIHAWFLSEMPEIYQQTDLALIHYLGARAVARIGHYMLQNSKQNTTIAVLSNETATLHPKPINATKYCMKGAMLNISFQMPWISACCIDVGLKISATKLADAIHLTKVFPHYYKSAMFALKGRQVWKQALTAVSNKTPKLGDFRGRSVLITGWMGRTGMVLARGLIEQAANYVLCGEDIVQCDPISQQSIRNAWELHLQLSGKLHVISGCNLPNASDSRNLVCSLRQKHISKLDMLIHADGELQSSEMRQNVEAAEHSFDAKVYGAWALENEIVKENYSVDTFVLVSNVSTQISTSQHSIYASANAFLDGFAYKQHAAAVIGKYLTINVPACEEDSHEIVEATSKSELVSALIQAIFSVGKQQLFISKECLIDKMMDQESPMIHESAETAKHTASLTEEFLQLFQETLNAQDFDLNSSFVDRGGDSLSAMQLINVIEHRYAVKLHHNDLVSYSTPLLLSCYVNEVKSGGQTYSEKIVVPLRNEHLPVTCFLIHGVGGGLFKLRDLALRLPACCNYVGIQHPQNDTKMKVNHLKQLASIYADAICEFLSKDAQTKSVILMGYSFGGIMAFELSSLLTKRGILVEPFVVMFDSWAKVELKDSLTNRLNAQMQEFLVDQIAVDYNLTKQSVSSLPFIRETAKQMEFLTQLLIEHKLTKRAVQIYLFKAMQFLLEDGESTKIQDFESNYWQPYSHAPVSISVAQGNHLNILHDQNNARLNEVLSQIVNEASNTEY